MTRPHILWLSQIFVTDVESDKKVIKVIATLLLKKYDANTGITQKTLMQISEIVRM